MSYFCYKNLLMILLQGYVSAVRPELKFNIHEVTSLLLIIRVTYLLNNHYLNIKFIDTTQLMSALKHSLHLIGIVIKI